MVRRSRVGVGSDSGGKGCPVCEGILGGAGLGQKQLLSCEPGVRVRGRSSKVPSLKPTLPRRISAFPEAGEDGKLNHGTGAIRSDVSEENRVSWTEKL
jgi:hypothetical protein